MPERQRRILFAVGVAIFVFGIGLGIWAIVSSQGDVSISSRAWSADGQRLVFGWNNSLYTVNVNGTHLNQLSSMPGDYLEPGWSPIADRIVYMFRRSQSAKYALWLIDALGQNAQRALPEESLDEFYPNWSPDGKWLGLYRTPVYDGSPSEYGYGYFILTDFNSVHKQPEELEITDDMAWSPDSKEIAFTGFNGNAWNIYSLATDGTNPQRLTDSGYDRSPAWSPTGKQLAFYSERDTRQNWIGSIYVLDLPSRNVKRVTGIVDRTYHIQWSPDGKKIALTTYRYETNKTDVYLMNPNGTDLQIVGTDIGGLISWSPNGQFLTFTSSNCLVVLDANIGTVVLTYHPRVFEQFLFFLPISTAECIALVSLLLGPVVTVSIALVLPRLHENSRVEPL
jgi:TolB protein